MQDYHDSMKFDHEVTPRGTIGMRTLLRTAGKVQQPMMITVQSPKSTLQFGRFDALKTNVEPSEMSTPGIASTVAFDPATDSLHASMRPIIILAQCFSLLPVCGVNTPDASYLRFSWRSWKLLYCTITFLSASAMTVCNILRLSHTGINSSKATSLVFYGTHFIAIILFLRLAKQWPRLALTWEKVEREFMTRPRKKSKISLATRFKIMTAIVMIIALLEHTLSILNGYFYAVECIGYYKDLDIISLFFVSQFPQVFARISYSLWKAIVVDVINILATFSWNFVDLFLILISIALTDQFRQLNNRLYSIRSKAMPDWWWAEIRNDYNHLATLTRRVDSHVSGIVLLSFATNLYFICIQLLFSFNLQRSIIKKIYFCFSFGFLLARTITVSLYAASVHDESLLPAPILYSVSGSSYSTEVIMRFLTQVTTDKISLTGMKFFSITRSLVLTVAGTIVTYELVLVQFNSMQQENTGNITSACQSFDLEF